MHEEIKIKKYLKKSEKYESLIPQVYSLINGENDLIANLSNIASALKYGMDFLWVGFYFVKNISKDDSEEKEELVLGPFQGPVACTRIGYGKGVCGKSWKEKRVILVDDVENFPGHIACSSLSKSEIVLPVFDRQKKVVLLLDIDSERLSEFDETDETFLLKIVALIESKWQPAS